MSNLDPMADEAVRCAVEAFVAGDFVPAFRGETIFETKNSRYRLLDGVVIDAPDDSLVGAELVGWLLVSEEGGVVEPAWRTGARAVLVDRRRARNIVVTSQTSLRTEGARGSSPRRQTSVPAADFGAAERSPIRTPMPPALTSSPAISARRAPILAATPLPGSVAPVPVPVPAPSPSSSEPSQPRPAIHPPPRPIAASYPGPLPRPAPPPPPVPPPAPPPPRAPLPAAMPVDDQLVSSTALPLVTRLTRPSIDAAPIAVADDDTDDQASDWEVTSAEMEIAADSEAGVPTGRHIEQHDTLEDIPYTAPDPGETPESTSGAPFLLTRPSPQSVPPPPDGDR
jgi:hypothetical protein